MLTREASVREKKEILDAANTSNRGDRPKRQKSDEGPDMSKAKS